MKLWRLMPVVVLALAASHAPVHAQAPSAPSRTSAPSVAVEGDDKPWNRGVPIEKRQAARDLFLEGNRLFKIPLFGRAAEKYLAALAEWKHPAFHFNLALAELNLGQDVEARDHLEQALRHGAEPLGQEQYLEAKKQLKEVERQLGRLRISCPTPGAEITLDGAKLFVGPGSYEGWVKARDHQITAKAPNYLADARHVTVASGKLEELDLQLVTLGDVTDRSRRFAVWKPWAVVGAGAAIAAGAGVIHALSSRNFNSYDDDFLKLDCAKNGGCSKDQIGPDLNNRLDLARREQQIAVAGYIAGGAVFATGVVLLVLNRPRLQDERASRSSDGVAIVPAISSDTLGIVVSVRR